MINILIYEGKNGTRVDLKSDDFETMWCTQAQIAMLFDCSRNNVTEHIQKIFKEGELNENNTCRKFRHVSTNQEILHYNLDMIIAVGYRVNSAKATQFRIWATKILKEYIIKGFAMDDERLKDPKGNQYFKELLERVKEIRTSEKIFYQQIKDIYTTAIDYQEKKNTEEVKDFFAKIQNKLHFAITGKTTAELIIERHNVKDGNFGLTSWKDSIIRKGDICIAKNYYNEKELKLLKSLINTLLDHLELQSQLQNAIKLQDWQEYTDNLIKFNNMQLLENKGEISNEKMKSIVEENFKIFDNKRKEIEKEEATKEAIEDLKKIEEEVQKILKIKKIIK